MHAHTVPAALADGEQSNLTTIEGQIEELGNLVTADGASKTACLSKLAHLQQYIATIQRDLQGDTIPQEVSNVSSNSASTPTSTLGSPASGSANLANRFGGVQASANPKLSSIPSTSAPEGFEHVDTSGGVWKQVAARQSGGGRGRGGRSGGMIGVAGLGIQGRGMGNIQRGMTAQRHNALRTTAGQLGTNSCPHSRTGLSDMSPDVLDGTVIKYSIDVQKAKSKDQYPKASVKDLEALLLVVYNLSAPILDATVTVSDGKEDDLNDLNIIKGSVIVRGAPTSSVLRDWQTIAQNRDYKNWGPDEGCPLWMEALEIKLPDVNARKQVLAGVLTGVDPGCRSTRDKLGGHHFFRNFTRSLLESNPNADLQQLVDDPDRLMGLLSVYDYAPSGAPSRGKRNKGKAQQNQNRQRIVAVARADTPAGDQAARLFFGTAYPPGSSLPLEIPYGGLNRMHASAVGFDNGDVTPLIKKSSELAAATARSTFVWKVDGFSDTFLEVEARRVFLQASKVTALLAIHPSFITKDGTFGLYLVFARGSNARMKDEDYYRKELNRLLPECTLETAIVDTAYTAVVPTHATHTDSDAPRARPGRNKQIGTVLAQVAARRFNRRTGYVVIYGAGAGGCTGLYIGHDGEENASYCTYRVPHSYMHGVDSDEEAYDEIEKYWGPGIRSAEAVYWKIQAMMPLDASNLDVWRVKCHKWTSARPISLNNSAAAARQPIYHVEPIDDELFLHRYAITSAVGRGLFAHTRPHLNEQFRRLDAFGGTMTQDIARRLIHNVQPEPTRPLLGNRDDSSESHLGEDMSLGIGDDDAEEEGFSQESQVKIVAVGMDVDNAKKRDAESRTTSPSVEQVRYENNESLKVPFDHSAHVLAVSVPSCMTTSVIRHVLSFDFKYELSKVASVTMGQFNITSVTDLPNACFIELKSKQDLVDLYHVLRDEQLYFKGFAFMLQTSDYGKIRFLSVDENAERISKCALVMFVMWNTPPDFRSTLRSIMITATSFQQVVSWYGESVEPFVTRGTDENV